MSVAQIYDLYAQKLSDITNIPYPYIISLRDNGLLDQKEARDKLIRHDYWKLVKTNKFTHNQILEKLSGIYDVNKRKILYAIKVKPKRIYYCRQCGLQAQYLQPIITQYFIDNKSEIWLLFLIAHSKR
jgi:hypothetical protein